MATSPSWQYNDARQIADVDDRSVDAAQQINWHPDRSSCQVAMALSPSRPLVFLWVATLFCCTASQMLQYTHQKQTQELDLLLNGSASYVVGVADSVISTSMLSELLRLQLLLQSDG